MIIVTLISCSVYSEILVQQFKRLSFVNGNCVPKYSVVFPVEY